MLLFLFCSMRIHAPTNLALSFVHPICFSHHPESFIVSQRAKLLKEEDKESGDKKTITSLAKSTDRCYFLTASLHRSRAAVAPLEGFKIFLQALRKKEHLSLCTKSSPEALRKHLIQTYPFSGQKSVVEFEWISFSNWCRTLIHILADSDEQEVVQQVQEFYADFVALDPFLCTLNMPSNYINMLPAVVDPSTLQCFCDRAVDSNAAVFLALKRRPIIRYQRTSDVAKRIAQEAAKLIYQQESGPFDFRQTEVSPLLLVIDRRDDPVSPLLNQWTY